MAIGNGPDRAVASGKIAIPKDPVASTTVKYRPHYTLDEEPRLALAPP
jgi:hypothetical protein